MGIFFGSCIVNLVDGFRALNRVSQAINEFRSIYLVDRVHPSAGVVPRSAE